VWGLSGIAPDFNSRLLEPDWDRFAPLFEARSRECRIGRRRDRDADQRTEAFTPDGEFILGESAVAGFWVAAGFCAHGIAGSGGMGKLMAEWIIEGQPSLDAWALDSRRFGPQYRSREYTLIRTDEIYATYYDVKYPARAPGRATAQGFAGQRASRDLGAAFGEKSGWERVNWYESNVRSGDESTRPDGWAGMLWSPAIGAEHLACREIAALFDESSFSKLDVTGPGAPQFLERLCANGVARRIGAVTYTQLLNRAAASNATSR